MTLYPKKKITHSKILIGEESFLSPNPSIPLLSISQEHLQLIALAEESLSLGPSLMEFAVLIFKALQSRLNL